MKKNARIVVLTIIILLAVAVTAFFIYEVAVLGKKDGNIAKFAVILISLAATAFKVAGSSPKGPSVEQYKKVYAEHIGRAFENDPKSEKIFYNALKKYNENNFPKAIKLLSSLEKNSLGSEERYAIGFFKALAYTDMGVYYEAILQYDAILSIKQSSTVASNMGFCYSEIGKYDNAVELYMLALDLEPNNPFAHNNLSAAYMRIEKYDLAIEYADKAIGIDRNMHQPHSTKAICYAFMEDFDKSLQEYKLAVSCGANAYALRTRLVDLGVKI